jgi:hypothetical protein
MLNMACRDSHKLAGHQRQQHGVPKGASEHCRKNVIVKDAERRLQTRTYDSVQIPSVLLALVESENMVSPVI